jgi:uncharacterized damage-inducible protein DinB
MGTTATVDLIAAHDQIVAVIRMIPDAALDWRPGGENWTLKDIISHLAHANDFYVMIVDEARATNYARVRLHPELAGFRQMTATDAAVVQCATVLAALACFERAFQRMLTVLQGCAPEELDRPFSLSLSWQPDIEPVTTTLAQRVLTTAVDHLREHQTQLSDTLARWQATHRERG